MVQELFRFHEVFEPTISKENELLLICLIFEVGQNQHEKTNPMQKLENLPLEFSSIKFSIMESLKVFVKF
jgi:hypothetical protein